MCSPSSSSSVLAWRTEDWIFLGRPTGRFGLAGPGIFLSRPLGRVGSTGPGIFLGRPLGRFGSTGPGTFLGRPLGRLGSVGPPPGGCMFIGGTLLNWSDAGNSLI